MMPSIDGTDRTYGPCPVSTRERVLGIPKQTESPEVVLLRDHKRLLDGGTELL
jgi:hypothetical protein